jgi:ketosteroid isomerase-like protein
VSLALFVALICALASGARADDQQAISDLEHKYVVTTDPDEVMKYWDSGDDVVLYDPMPPREFAGYKAIRNHMEDFARNKDLKVDFLELQVIGDGKLALARSVQHFTSQGCRWEADRCYVPEHRPLAENTRSLENHQFACFVPGRSEDWQGGHGIEDVSLTTLSQPACAFWCAV